MGFFGLSFSSAGLVVCCRELVGLLVPLNSYDVTVYPVVRIYSHPISL